MKKVIQIVLALGFFATSSMAQVSSTEPNGIEDANTLRQNSNELHALLYPNPVLDETHVYLAFPAENKVYVDLMDFNGRLITSQVFAPGGNQFDLDLGDVPAGKYSLRIHEPGMQTQFIQLLKQ